ncbi:MAG: LysM peptidoglycan-binding domain-containing protein [Acidobacteriota bacterium]|nr:LysM peptidoglycan-binding domain-containing protein [Acidobacteriota bacterium]
MFDQTSRYANLVTVTISVTDPDGAPREIRYVRRRLIPPAEALTALVEHTVVEGDRLDNITARYLGDPTEFWRVCDANNVLRPADLTDEIGRIIKIALPEF